MQRYYYAEQVIRITAKGQVTIPVAIREKAGLLPHTEMEFELDGDAVRIVKYRSPRGDSRGERAVRLLRGSRSVRMTTDEIMALMRGDRRNDIEVAGLRPVLSTATSSSTSRPWMRCGRLSRRPWCRAWPTRPPLSSIR